MEGKGICRETSGVSSLRLRSLTRLKAVSGEIFK